jgi:uncharacterized protein (TIGR02646 family)
MQYIKKQNEPPEHWDEWFTTATGRRTFDYNADNRALRNLAQAKQFLIDEQHGLCAYCQKTINQETSSIEHVIPKEFSVELSTCYYNLVAVCKKTPEDENGKLHCDKEKQSKLITPFIFASNCDVTGAANNSYFAAGAGGMLAPKEKIADYHKFQVEAFINILNLNHAALIGNRNEALNGIFAIYRSISTDKDEQKKFWHSQFQSILLNKSRSYRQFLLIFIGKKVGKN